MVGVLPTTPTWNIARLGNSSTQEETEPNIAVPTCFFTVGRGYYSVVELF